MTSGVTSKFSFNCSKPKNKLTSRADPFSGISVAVNLDDGAEMESDLVKIIGEHRLINETNLKHLKAHVRFFFM